MWCGPLECGVEKASEAEAVPRERAMWVDHQCPPQGGHTEERHLSCVLVRLESQAELGDSGNQTREAGWRLTKEC